MSACAPAQLGKRDEGGGAGHPATNPCPAPNATQELLLREGLWAGGLAKSLGFSLIALRRVFFVSVALPPVLNIPRICSVHRMQRSSSNLSGRGASVLAFPFSSGGGLPREGSSAGLLGDGALSNQEWQPTSSSALPALCWSACSEQPRRPCAHRSRLTQQASTPALAHCRHTRRCWPLPREPRSRCGRGRCPLLCSPSVEGAAGAALP